MVQNKLFSIGDYIHFGIATLMATICFVGAGLVNDATAKIISTATGLVFLASLVIVFFVFRLPAYRARRKELESFLGPIQLENRSIDFFLSTSLTELEPTTVSKWTENLIDFWVKHEGWDREDIESALMGTHVYAHDLEYLDVKWPDGTVRKVYGYTQAENKHVEIAVGKDMTPGVAVVRARDLWRHELSHIIVAEVGGYWDGKSSHELFAKVGLNA